MVVTGGSRRNELQVRQTIQDVFAQMGIDKDRKNLALCCVRYAGGIANIADGDRIVLIDVLPEVLLIGSAHFKESPPRHSAPRV